MDMILSDIVIPNARQLLILNGFKEIKIVKITPDMFYFIDYTPNSLHRQFFF